MARQPSDVKVGKLPLVTRPPCNDPFVDFVPVCCPVGVTAGPWVLQMCVVPLPDASFGHESPYQGCIGGYVMFSCLRKLCHNVSNVLDAGNI